MSRTRALLAAVIAVALLLTACSGDDDAPERGAPGDDPTAQALATVADEVAITGYEKLVARLDDLTSALEELCADPGDLTRSTARSAWAHASLAWQATRATVFGPAMDRRLTADVGFAARAGSVDHLLEGTDPVDPEGLAAQGSGVRGIYAVELLLFGEGSDDLLTEAGARRCEMATSASALASVAATAVLDDWTAAYRDDFVAGLEGDPLLSVDALVNKLVAALTAVDDMGLRDLVAAETFDDVSVLRQDGPGANRMAQHRALVDAVALAIAGPGGDGSGLAAIVEERSPDTATRLVEASDAAVAAMDPLPDSVADAFADRDALARADEAVAALKVLLTTEVASQLGITIRFSDADGDS